MAQPPVHPHGELHNPDTAYEHSDINLGAIVAFAVLLAVITLTIQAAVYGIFVMFNHFEQTADRTVSPLEAPAGTAPPEPRLQTTPWSDLQQLRAAELLYLHSYGWIDKDRGIAHMPIEKAKALLLQKGLPVRPGLADPTEGTSFASTGESSGGRNLPASGPDRSAPAAPPAASPRAPQAPGGTALNPPQATKRGGNLR